MAPLLHLAALRSSMAGHRTPALLQTAVLLLLLLLGLASCRRTTKQVDKPPTATSCSSKKGSSAIAVSVVYAQCQGDVVLAAESLAQAAVSGCGDAYAAGVGVSIAAMEAVGDGGLGAVLTDTFAGVISVSQSINAAAAASQGIAFAFGSALPSEMNAPDFLAGVAWSIGEVAGPNGTDCLRASKVAVAFYNGLTIAAPDATTAFAAAVGLYVPQCKKLAKLAAVAAADDLKSDAQLARLAARVNGGIGRGRCKVPLFSAAVGGQVKSSSLAVTIAETTCPMAGNATVAAIAIATAAKTDRSIASAAIAGVLYSNVDLSATFYQAAALATPERRLAVQAFAAAIVGSDAAAQDLLIFYMGKALKDISKNIGCDVAADVLLQIQGTIPNAEEYGVGSVPAVTPLQMKQLCSTVPACACPKVVGK